MIEFMFVTHGASFKLLNSNLERKTLGDFTDAWKCTSELTLFGGGLGFGYGQMEKQPKQSSETQ